MEEALKLVNQAMQEAEVQRRNEREGGRDEKSDKEGVGGKEGETKRV